MDTELVTNLAEIDRDRAKVDREWSKLAKHGQTDAVVFTHPQRHNSLRMGQGPRLTKRNESLEQKAGLQKLTHFVSACGLPRDGA